MFLFDWWYNILSFLAALGLYQKRATILFLGLDNAGKTALLYVLKEGRVAIHTQPTYKTYPVELTLGMMSYKTFDMGGTLNARRLWRDFYESGAVDGVVFVVDAEDRRRFPEAKAELDTLLSCDALAKVPFLVIGNKVDLKSATSEEELKYQLGLDDKTYGKEYSPLAVFRKMSPDRRPIGVFMCSVVQQSGYNDGTHTEEFSVYRTPQTARVVVSLTGRRNAVGTRGETFSPMYIVTWILAAYVYAYAPPQEPNKTK